MLTRWVGNRVMPLIDASVLRRARAAVPVPDPPSLDGMQVVYSAPFRQEMAERHFQPCMHALREQRRRLEAPALLAQVGPSP